MQKEIRPSNSKSASLNPKREAGEWFKKFSTLAKGVKNSINFSRDMIKNSPFLNLSLWISKEAKSSNLERDLSFESQICLLESQKI